MDVDWGTLGGVSGVSLGITVVVVVMFSLGIAAWSRAGGDGPRRGAPGAPRRGPGRRSGRAATERAALVTAVVCFAACLAVAAYGIDVIIPE